MFEHTALFAPVLALIYMILTIRVVSLRKKYNVPIGPASEVGLQRAILAHQNFSEYAPISLILLLVAENTSTPARFIQVFGTIIVAGRILHALAISRVPEMSALRVTGMLCTLIPIIAMSLNILLRVFGMIS